MSSGSSQYEIWIFLWSDLILKVGSIFFFLGGHAEMTTKFPFLQYTFP